MGFYRQTQHKPANDNKKAKEVADLKRDNNHLRKQISRMRKQIGKMVDLHGLDMPMDPDPNEIPEVIEESKPVTVDQCEKCGGSARVISVGGKLFMCCMEKCGWKKLLKGEEEIS